MKQADTMKDIEQIKASLEQLLEEIRCSSGQEEVDEARRKTWRYAWPAPATAEVLKSDGAADGGEVLYITVHNISMESMDFYSPQALETDQKVVVTLETSDGQLSIPGTVTHSISSVGKPLVAIRFDFDD